MKEGEPVLGGPQANPGVAGMSNSGTQPIFSGTQTAPVIEPVVPVAPQPAIPQSSAPQQNRYITQPPSHFTPQQPTSSDTGDIILAGVEPKKSKTPLIIAIIVVLLLIAGGVAAYFLLGRGDTGQTGDVSESKEAFNYYVNYILFGEDSGEDVDEDSILDNTPYFMTIQPSEFFDYVETANNKFDKFAEEYSENSGEYNLLWAKSFFQDSVLTMSLTDKDIIQTYLSEGEKAAEDLIENTYNIDDSNEYLDEYLFIQKQIAKLKLNKFISAQSQGCLGSDKVLECYIPVDGEENTVSDLSITSSDALDNLYFSAVSVLDNVYREIYNIDEPKESL